MYASVYHMPGVPGGQKKGVKLPGIGVTNNLSHHMGAGK